MPKAIINEFLKTANKEKNFVSNQRETIEILWGRTVEMTMCSDMHIRKKWQNIFQVLEENNCDKLDFHVSSKNILHW